jgi:hypothetical protein
MAKTNVFGLLSFGSNKKRMQETITNETIADHGWDIQRLNTKENKSEAGTIMEPVQCR